MKKTQSSSKKRVKFDGIGGETILTMLYDNYKTMDELDFKDYCKNLIDQSVSSNEKKIWVKNKIQQSLSKDNSLKITQNFIMAGLGYGV